MVQGGRSGQIDLTGSIYLQLALATKSNTYVGERTHEAKGLGLSRIDAAVDRAEEEVGAIAETDLGIFNAIGHARETAKIGNGHGAVRRVTADRMVVY